MAYAFVVPSEVRDDLADVLADILAFEDETDDVTFEGTE